MPPPQGRTTLSARCHGIRGDALIAPYAPSTGIPCVTFGRTEPSAPTSFYRTLFFLCHSEGAKRPWESVPVSCQQRPKAATYLCRFAAKARFDNRQPPEGVSKEGGPQPSLFGRSRMGDFQGGRKIETSFPLEWRFWLLLSLLTKVTRRRQKKKNIPGGAEPRPYTRLPIAFTPSVRADVGIRPYEITGGVCVIRTGGADPSAPTSVCLPKTHQDLRPRRRSCPQFSYNISRATGR